MKPERGVLACRAILDRQVIHTRDAQAEPELLPIYRDLGIRSILAIPLLRDDNAVGAFAMNSRSRAVSQTARSRCFRPSPSRR